ncbi:MAG: leucine-rich repeat domain-containing protein [Oscillospiraceae bacterium]|nr:leucine-rich repeat domain-containing protein [Oscillospiraceae bacterium]
MKHKIKIIVPLVLIVALLAAACWFFLAVKPDWTSSVFAYWADRLVISERYNRAISLYKIAGNLTPDNARVPVVLAETYVKAGNFTKAEYTLVSAITKDPDDVQLYTALSRIYVQQDKLLDAEQMLSRITHDEVREKIEPLRPEAPVITPESGYYNEYIDVTASCPNGTVYLTTDGTYPTISDDLYEAPVTLKGGETKLTAVAVGSNGLVSDVVRAGYTVGNVVEPAELQDAAIDAYVREVLGKYSTDEIMTDELWEVKELVIPETATTLADLSYFTGLQSLTVHNSANLDLSIIGQLTTLQELDVSGCTLSTSLLEMIGALPDLTKLNISNCAVSSINPLVGLTKLTYLNLAHNTISDITVLSSMTELTELNLSNNPIRTITYLNNCLKLQRLYVENCSISKLSSIAGNTVIEEIHAAENSIDDISVLDGCTALRILDITGNEVADISVLPKLPELMTFKADHNKITTIPKFDPATSKLVQFNVNYNEIADLSALAGLHTLNYVRADYNKVTDVTCLKDNYRIIQIDVWDNPINVEGIAAMQEVGIIVNYNPTYQPPQA